MDNKLVVVSVATGIGSGVALAVSAITTFKVLAIVSVCTMSTAFISGIYQGFKQGYTRK